MQKKNRKRLQLNRESIRGLDLTSVAGGLTQAVDCTFVVNCTAACTIATVCTQVGNGCTVAANCSAATNCTVGCTA